jgi:hypothetical protein
MDFEEVVDVVVVCAVGTCLVAHLRAPSGASLYSIVGIVTCGSAGLGPVELCSVWWPLPAKFAVPLQSSSAGLDRGMSSHQVHDVRATALCLRTAM